jgi:hypothetical protein
VVAAIACLSSLAPEFMTRVQDPEMMSIDPVTSNFVASGGLVPDDAPSAPATDNASNHAAGADPAPERATTF